MLTCEQCGDTTSELAPSVHGLLCPQCAYRQAERDQYGHGLAPGTWGFDSETE